jgi:hypothetical protein
MASWLSSSIKRDAGVLEVELLREIILLRKVGDTLERISAKTGLVLESPISGVGELLTSILCSIRTANLLA